MNSLSIDSLVAPRHRRARLAALLLVLLAPQLPRAALAGPGTPVDEFADPGFMEYDAHRRSGDELFATQQYEAALREYKAAYAKRQNPELLFYLGRTERKLGQARAALDYFDRFLVTEPVPPSTRGLEAQREAAVLRGQIAARAAASGGAGSLSAGMSLPEGVTLIPVRKERRRNTGLVTAGAVTLGLNYAAAFIGGAFLAATGRNRSFTSGRDEQTAGGLLLIPVLGPFVTGIALREVYWAAPWAAVDGLAQLCGLIMLVSGARDVHDVMVPAAVFESRLMLMPTFGPHGTGGVSLSGVF